MLVAAGTTLNDEVAAVRLQEIQRLAEFGRLSAHLLHEISNPLTAAILHLEQYADRPASSVRQAQQSIRLLQRYVEAARQQARREGQATTFYVRPQLRDIKRVLTPVARHAGVRLEIEPIANCKLFGDPVKFQQIIANLIINAVDAYDGMTPGSYQKTVQVHCEVNQDWLLIHVLDRGAGIPADQMAHIFEPFYTTKISAGSGLGIGLALVKRYVEQEFGGSIEVMSSTANGTCFAVRFKMAGVYAQGRLSP